jgi:hypothetical protein
MDLLLSDRGALRGFTNRCTFPIMMILALSKHSVRDEKRIGTDKAADRHDPRFRDSVCVCTQLYPGCTHTCTHVHVLNLVLYLSGVLDVPLKVHARVSICPMLYMDNACMHCMSVVCTRVTNTKINISTHALRRDGKPRT